MSERMSPHEHTHEEINHGTWPTICQEHRCDVWPRIVDLEVYEGGSSSYSHVSNKQDFIARRLNEVMFDLGWASGNAETLEKAIDRARAMLLSTYPYLAPILYPDVNNA